MRNLVVMLVALVSGNVLASEPPHLMSAARVSCGEYLELTQPDATNLDYWVAGRIAAIAPATFQGSLAKIPFSQMRSDLRAFCQDSKDINMFQASAVLIYNYQRVPR